MLGLKLNRVSKRGHISIANTDCSSISYHRQSTFSDGKRVYIIFVHTLYILVCYAWRKHKWCYDRLVKRFLAVHYYISVFVRASFNNRQTRPLSGAFVSRVASECFLTPSKCSAEHDCLFRKLVQIIVTDDQGFTHVYNSGHAWIPNHFYKEFRK